MIFLSVSASWQSRLGFSRYIALNVGVPVGLLTVLKAIGMF
jgi:hypothetical protein